MRGKSPFSISDVSCASGDSSFSFKPAEEAREVHLIPVTFTATEKTGKFVERINIKIDDGKRSVPEVVAHVEVSDQQ